ncbi:MAG TPA: hypothetical protein VFX60_19125 [Micromonospora sp.]|nr:hypothetical protein [Micromonospora sp.]
MTELPDLPPTAVGIDPSLTGTGIAHSDGRCARVGKTGISALPLLTRVAAVDSLVVQILHEVGRPDVVLIETPAYSSASGAALERHALWWTLVRALRDWGIPVAEVSIQRRMRYATGRGQATKGQVIEAVTRRWPAFAHGGDDNMADAAVLAAMGAHWLGVPLAPVPQTHAAALDGVDWPVLPR